jgi:hypothetical protein
VVRSFHIQVARDVVRQLFKLTSPVFWLGLLSNFLQAVDSFISHVPGYREKPAAFDWDSPPNFGDWESTMMGSGQRDETAQGAAESPSSSREGEEGEEWEARWYKDQGTSGGPARCAGVTMKKSSR